MGIPTEEFDFVRHVPHNGESFCNGRSNEEKRRGQKKRRIRKIPGPRDGASAGLRTAVRGSNLQFSLEGFLVCDVADWTATGRAIGLCETRDLPRQDRKLGMGIAALIWVCRRGEPSRWRGQYARRTCGSYRQSGMCSKTRILESRLFGRTDTTNFLPKSKRRLLRPGWGSARLGGVLDRLRL